MNSWNKRIRGNDKDLLIASALDSGPWAINFFEKHGCVQSIKNILLEELKKYPQQKKKKNITISRLETAWTRLQGMEDIEPLNDLKDQIKSYIASATVWTGTCLEFWKKNVSRFPAFESLLQKYFSFCAAVERIFSTCGHLVTKRINSLNFENVEAFIF